MTKGQRYCRAAFGPDGSENPSLDPALDGFGIAGASAARAKDILQLNEGTVHIAFALTAARLDRLRVGHFGKQSQSAESRLRDSVRNNSRSKRRIGSDSRSGRASPQPGRTRVISMGRLRVFSERVRTLFAQGHAIREFEDELSSIYSC